MSIRRELKKRGRYQLFGGTTGAFFGALTYTIVADPLDWWMAAAIFIIGSLLSLLIPATRIILHERRLAHEKT